jgi:hypothetical protein
MFSVLQCNSIKETIVSNIKRTWLSRNSHCLQTYDFSNTGKEYKFGDNRYAYCGMQTVIRNARNMVHIFCTKLIFWRDRRHVALRVKAGLQS